MTFGNSEGQRRCDEKCYNASGPECTCCCGGANHGAGLAKATANTRKIAEEMLQDAKEHGHLKFDGTVVQEDLF